MNKSILTIVLCLPLFFSCRKDGLGALESKVEIQLPPPGYQLSWNDEFDSTELDLTKWMHRYPGPRRQGFNSPEAVYIDTVTGNLVIRSFMRNDTAFTGMVATRDRYTQRYGYFECRAKVSHIFPGYWTAFWVQSKDIGVTLDPAVSGVEMDVMEFVGGNPYRVNHALHWNGYGWDQQSKSWETVSQTRFDEGYHIYSLEWTPDYYRFYIDHRLVWQESEPISQMEQYAILSAEISNKAQFQAKYDEGIPIVFEIDYLRIYQLPEQEIIDQEPVIDE